MEPLEHSSTLTVEDSKREQAAFMTGVYGWMSAALCLTALVAVWTASSETAISFIFGNRLVFYGLLIAQFLMVMGLSNLIDRLSAKLATLAFLAYAGITGLTLSSIFLVFTEASIASTFFVTAGTFGAMSAYGYFTKSDLTSWGNLFLMALVGLIIASVVNMFLGSETLYWITTYVGVLLFVGLTAYDTQKIKNLNIIGNAGTEEDHKEAIMGALVLYLDFINLFLYLLRLLGRRK